MAPQISTIGGFGSVYGLHRRERLSYRDTPDTVAMWAATEALNGFLVGADISFVEDGLDDVDTSERSRRSA